MKYNQNLQRDIIGWEQSSNDKCKCGGNCQCGDKEKTKTIKNILTK